MSRPQLPATCLAFGGGLPLFAGESGDETANREVEIALSGQYKTRDFALGAKQFEEIIKNHQAAGVDPAIDREHESWFSFEPAEARGWVKGLEVRPAAADKRRSALVAHIELNDLGLRAVKNKHFRYLSIGLDKAGKHRQSGEPIGAVLDHLALVKNPFIQGMQPLSLSTNFGHVVDGVNPMELLSQKLRTSLGLSADAPEEQIIAAFEASKNKADADQSALKAAQDQAASEAKARQMALAEVQSLSTRLESLENDKWSQRVAAAVAEFRLTPAEGAEYVKLSGVERTMAEKLLGFRAPNKPAPEVKTDTTAATVRDGNIKAQNDAIAAYRAVNPQADEVAALMACALANPALFNAEAI